MSDEKRTATEQLDSLLDAYLKDLLELPDEELVAEVMNPKEEQASFEAMVTKARVEAGQRRLAKAKKDLADRPSVIRLDQPVDIEQARQYLVGAANDRRFTLAARDLRELPDEEVTRIYLQIKQLEDENSRE